MIDLDKLDEAEKELEDYVHKELKSKHLNNYTEDQLKRFDELLNRINDLITFIKDNPR